MQKTVLMIIAVLSFLLLNSQTLIYFRVSDSLTLNPYESNDFYSNEVLSNIVETLVDYDLQKRVFLPLLAEGWQAEDNARRWVFNLRRDVFFHNGEPLTAHLVVDALKKSRVSSSFFPFRKKFFFDNLIDLKALNNRQLQFVFNRSFPNLLAFLCTIQNAIIHPASYQEKNFLPIGTGPFKFHSWENEAVVLQKNHNYWRAGGNIEKIYFQTIREAGRRISAMLSAQADIASISSPLEFNELMAAKNLTIISRPSLSLFYLAFNTKQYPFNKLEARLAVKFALDLERIIPYVYQKTVTIARSLLPPDLFFEGYNPVVSSVNLNKARNLFRQTGIKSGQKIALCYGSGNVANRQLAERIALNLKKIGLEVEKKEFNFKDLLIRLDQGEYQLVMLGWTEDIDPLLFLYPLFMNPSSAGASNRSFYYNAELNRLFELAFTAATLFEKQNYLKQIMALLERELPLIPLFHYNESFCHQKSVKKLMISPKGYLIFREAVKEVR